MIKINSKNKITYSILTALIFCIGMNLNSATDPNFTKLDDPEGIKVIKNILNDILKININIINLIIIKGEANFANSKGLNYAKSIFDSLPLTKIYYKLSAYALLPDRASSSEHWMSRYQHDISDRLDNMFNKIKEDDRINTDNTFKEYIKLANIMLSIKNQLKKFKQFKQIDKNLLNRYLQILRKQIMYLKSCENTESLKNFLDKISEKIRYLINKQLKNYPKQSWPDIDNKDYNNLGITEEDMQELKKYPKENPVL